MSDTISDSSPFSSFNLSGAMLESLARKGFTAPTSIQNIALPRLLAETGHLIVKARTGTGKTAAFGIPLIERIRAGGHAPRALILTPTRELALQISREIASISSGPFPRITAVYGGASIRNQILDLKRGTEIVVGTPGRIMDLMDRKVLDLSAVDWFILDEADEMLDMGFFEDVENILSQVKPERRIALFSATMPEAILKVVREYIGNIEILEDKVQEEERPAVDQFYMILKREDKLEALRRVIDSEADFYGLIFCATKIETDELARRLTEGAYMAEAIHGDLSQEARERTLRRFRSKQTRILVATDVAARGLDIERLTHVINWDLPQDRETYIHRIGRTGRAGRRGKAVSLALPAERERISRLSRSIERSLGGKIQWMKAPSVKSVMKALRSRIVLQVTASLPEIPPVNPSGLPDIQDAPPQPLPAVQNTANTEAADTSRQDALLPAQGDLITASDSPYAAKVCRQLIENLGAERAVEALITLHYGELLDPSRYASLTEFAEIPAHEAGRREQGRHTGNSHADIYDRRRRGRRELNPRKAGSQDADDGGRGTSRVYVGLGLRHGASARDVAGLLSRAGNIPGRLVDAIEMKEYCAFASLPADAARRACAFSRTAPEETPIRPADGKRR
ncbi:MAG: DEAD/DEAH box helicase [Treponema sp.]|jgi:ATP-dependent RNA helicase DeaD|nr:DEAD/DEAH box helicase [Treponema sp.]